ncbi:MAG: efflux RND transporter permease subunit, partial [Sphingomonadales bacterium]
MSNPVDKQISWWARNPVAANLLMIGILISGVLSFFQMEREVWPTFRLNWVEIQANWPGASPQEVEEQVILRIEEALNDLDNIQRVRARAFENGGWVYLEADPRIDINRFIADVKLRVDGISSFPRDMEPVRVREILARNELIRIAVHGNVPERELKKAADQVRREVVSLPGAAITELFGARREEVS